MSGEESSQLQLGEFDIPKMQDDYEALMDPIRTHIKTRGIKGDDAYKFIEKYLGDRNLTGIQSFVDDYLAQISPVGKLWQLPWGEAPIIDERKALAEEESRKQLLLRYLVGDSSLRDKEVDIAEGHLGEIIFADLFAQLCYEISPDLMVECAPYTVDLSDEASVGGDVILSLYQRHPDAIGPEMSRYPLLVVDVKLCKATKTLSNDEFGISRPMQAPTICIKLGSLELDIQGKKYSFREYLKDIVRPAIVLGLYSPYIGVEDEQIGDNMVELLKLLRAGWLRLGKMLADPPDTYKKIKNAREEDPRALKVAKGKLTMVTQLLLRALRQLQEWQMQEFEYPEEIEDEKA